ncbi:hypothetical protein SLEP1_g6616 [Rubroshorea leprosula]|uniref:Uncharacterized protein n=1 Tax=Rubroshorea leprosula TaxID=152421 RepID=A0AAV5I253_9ROSI|nr:hypothetical protein SLEP1_g6616 [Rubroshorea leprosula]
MDLDNNGEQYTELLQAQAHVWNHIFNFINTMSLKCAVDLGIPDIIHNHGHPMTITELVAVLPINAVKAPFVHRLMRILVHSGFFTCQKLGKNNREDSYFLTHSSRLLLKNEPMSATPFLNAMLEPILTKPWYHLASWLQNDNNVNAFATKHGTTFWECASGEPKCSHFFNNAMASDSRLVSRVLIDNHRNVFEGLSSLVDVGGGTGTLANAVANAFPHLDCIVFDLPHVVAGLKGRKNLKYVAGDMFSEIPPADAVLLKWILHDWSDEECLKILERCKEAIKKNGKGTGKVIIVDMVRKDEGDEESIETQLFFDMLMMVVTTGKERNEEELAKLFSEAGFSGYKLLPILGVRSLIEVYP